MYTALMVSSNVCTARLMDAIGVRPVIQLARVMGITTPIPYDYTISLGSNSVKLFEMTRAYGVFANGGFKVEPFAIERIESSRGTILYEAKKARSSKVLNLNTAATMTANYENKLLQTAQVVLLISENLQREKPVQQMIVKMRILSALLLMLLQAYGSVMMITLRWAGLQAEQYLLLSGKML